MSNELSPHPTTKKRPTPEDLVALREMAHTVAIKGEVLLSILDEISRLQAELAAVRKDAERYRWLRSPSGPEGKGAGHEQYPRGCLICHLEGAELDAEIDSYLAALAAGRGEK